MAFEGIAMRAALYLQRYRFEPYEISDNIMHAHSNIYRYVQYMTSDEQSTTAEKYQQ